MKIQVDETKKLNTTMPSDEFKAFYDLYEALSIILPPLDEKTNEVHGKKTVCKT